VSPSPRPPCRVADYAVNLGASGILLGPIFASSTHGYDTIDHFKSTNGLGTPRISMLIDAAHRRGLRVVLMRFNHVGREYPAFSAIAAGPRSTEAAWFRLTWPTDAALGQEPTMSPTMRRSRVHRQLVALNHDEPASRIRQRVMSHGSSAR